MSIVLVSENPANLGKVLTSLVNCLKINTAYFVLSCLTSLYFADTVVFYKLKTCGNPASSKSVGAILPRAFYHFVSLYHILVILIIFQAFPSFSSVQFSSVTQSCTTLCDPMNRSTPGLPVHHQLPEFTQTHVHRVGDAIQPSHPLSSPSPPAPNPSQHQSLFQ